MERFENIENKDCFPAYATLENTLPQTAANFGIFFIAPRPCEVMYIVEVHGTAGTDGGAVTFQVEKLTGTTAKGSGSDILLTAFNLKGTANTPQAAQSNQLSQTNRLLSTGDRLAIKSTGVLTALADLQVTVFLKPTNKGDYRI